MTNQWFGSVLNGRVANFASVLCLTTILGSGLAHAGPIMYVHDNQGRLGTVDVANGAVAVIGNLGVQLTDIGFDPAGSLYGISFTGIYRINAATAETTFVGNHGIASGNALVFGSDGTLYGAGAGTTSLFRIDVVTGASTNLGNMGFASGGDLAFNGGNFYLASASNELVRINLADIDGSSSVGLFGIGGVFGLATADNGNLYAVAGTTIYGVDTNTGALSIGQSFASQGLGQAFGQSFFTEAGAGGGTVPEPAAFTLVAIGLFSLAWQRRGARRHF